MTVVFPLVNSLKKDQTRPIVSPPVGVDIPSSGVFLLLENGIDKILLENGIDFLLLE